MARLTVALFAICVLGFVAGQTELRCYDCDPSSDKSNCKDPENGQEPTGPCSKIADVISSNPLKKRVKELMTEIEERTNAERSYNCYTIHLKQGNATSDLAKEPGVYRGCILRIDSKSVCDSLKEEFGASNAIGQCDECQADHCNNRDLRGVDGAAERLTGSMLAIVMVNLVLAIYVFNL